MLAVRKTFVRKGMDHQMQLPFWPAVYKAFKAEINVQEEQILEPIDPSIVTHYFIGNVYKYGYGIQFDFVERLLVLSNHSLSYFRNLNHFKAIKANGEPIISVPTIGIKSVKPFSI